MATKTVQTPFGPMTYEITQGADGSVDLKPILDPIAEQTAMLQKISGQLSDLNMMLVKILIK